MRKDGIQTRKRKPKKPPGSGDRDENGTGPDGGTYLQFSTLFYCYSVYSLFIGIHHFEGGAKARSNVLI